MLDGIETTNQRGQHAPLKRLSDTGLDTTSQVVWHAFRRFVKNVAWCFRIGVEASGLRYHWEEGIEGEAPSKTFKSRLFRNRGKKGTPAAKEGTTLCADQVTAEVYKRTNNRNPYFAVTENGTIVATPYRIDFSKPLPHNLRTPKPITSISPKNLRDLIKSGQARITRKYDGIGLTLVRHSWGWDAYTLEGNRVSVFFKEQLQELASKCDQFKVGTILKAEGVVFDSSKSGLDNLYKATGTYSAARQPESVLNLVKRRPERRATFVVYDILAHNESLFRDATYDSRQSLLEGELKKIDRSDLVRRVDFFPEVTPRNWRRILKEHGYEGFVIGNGNSTLGDQVFAFGRTPRAPGIYKLKDVFEEDVVIYAIRKDKGCYRSVFLKQRYPDYYPGTKRPHPQAGEWFRCGRCSLHQREDLRAELRKAVQTKGIPVVYGEHGDRDLDIHNDFGITVTIQFPIRTENQAFRDAQFGDPPRIRWRRRGPTRGDYKATKECVAQILGKKKTKE